MPTSAATAVTVRSVDPSSRLAASTRSPSRNAAGVIPISRGNTRAKCRSLIATRAASAGTDRSALRGKPSGHEQGVHEHVAAREVGQRGIHGDPDPAPRAHGITVGRHEKTSIAVAAGHESRRVQYLQRASPIEERATVIEHQSHNPLARHPSTITPRDDDGKDRLLTNPANLRQ